SHSFDQKEMAAAIAGGARTASGTVQDEVATTYQGFPARDARVPSQTNHATLFVRAIATPTRTYLLVYEVKGTDHASAPAGYAKFLSSLQLS
ncbi:MAG: hypothetical protein LC720_00775, partial [Actinobacteria bacterium]|nr:hypothetical protein [Actinomycetota bacterium]